MKNFICKKCGNTTYIIQEKSNGTGVATGLYCAKCGTWHKWLNKQEKVLYSVREKSDKDKEIARLTAENAELKARLEKAVELKAKVGDVIYMPWEYGGSNGVATLSIIGSDFHNDEFIYITDLESDSVYYLEKYKNGIFCDKDFDNIVFTDRAAAEARLAELKGGKE